MKFLAFVVVIVGLVVQLPEAVAQIEEVNTQEERIALQLQPEPGFDEAFGLSVNGFDRKVRRLRSVGWTLFAAGGLTWAVGISGLATSLWEDGAAIRVLIAAPVLSGVLWTISAGTLIRARRLLMRRSRWRESRGAVEEPRWDFRIGAGTAEWSLRF